MLECEDGSLYTGWSTDPFKREEAHSKGRGSAYTRLRKPRRLVYIEELADRSSALRREAFIKKMQHHQKIELAASVTNSLEEMKEKMMKKLEANQTSLIVLSPGRVNMLGEHVDYSDGIVLPAAIDRAVRITVRAIDEPLIRLQALDIKKQAVFSLENLEKKLLTNGEAMPNFVKYPAGVAWALQQAGCSLRGFEASYTSTIPMGAGLSSSAAVEVGFALVWKILGKFELDDMDLVKLCQKAENQYVGVNSGIMDQFACYFGVKDHALMFDTRSFSWQPVQLPAGTSIVIADSSVRRSLTTSGYNDRRADIEEAVRCLQAWLPNLKNLRDISPEQFYHYKSELPARPAKRAEHVVTEIARVQEAVPALEKGDGQEFGRLMAASHTSLRDLFEVSTPELDKLVEIASGLKGCLGARLTGAGFGGCTVNLVQTEHTADFIAQLGKGYTKATNKTAQIYCCRASQGAHLV
ncbi:MAG: galactokinase [Anaerolineaceae bacterium]|nr:galactokinase [Anaerolineaceae bacterium]